MPQPPPYSSRPPNTGQFPAPNRLMKIGMMMRMIITMLVIGFTYPVVVDHEVVPQDGGKQRLQSGQM